MDQWVGPTRNIHRCSRAVEITLGKRRYPAQGADSTGITYLRKMPVPPRSDCAGTEAAMMHFLRQNEYGSCALSGSWALRADTAGEIGKRPFSSVRRLAWSWRWSAP